MFDDRPKEVSVKGSALPKPEIHIIVDGNRVFKPGMKTVFVEDDDSVRIEGGTVSRGETVVTGRYCSCNSVSVCTCNTVCSCQGYAAYREIHPCTCDPVCTCDAVCTCESHCTCDTVCSCEGYCTCNTQSNTYCSCVPVH